mgnify:CR=1 FL=1
MDTFMDQLSQKLNAQQIIRANGEAESEAMGVMRAQVREYQECLDRMKNVAEELSGLQQTINALPDLGGTGSGVSENVIGELKEQMESMNKANEDYLQQMQNDLLAGQNDFIERQQSLAMSQNELMSRQSQMLEERSNELKEQIESIKATNEENLEKIRSGIAEGGNEELTRRLESFEEQIGAQLEALKTNVGSQIDAVRSSNEEYLARLQNDFAASAGNEDLLGMINSLSEEMSSKIDVLRDDVSSIKLQVEGIKSGNDKSLDQMKNDLKAGQREVIDSQNNLLTTMQNADVHKECVRVYRNVQASIQDENAKQLEAIREDSHSNLESYKSESGKSITAIRDESAKLLGSIRNDNAKQIEAIREENAKSLVNIRTETSKLEEQVGGVKKAVVFAVIVSIISIVAPFLANFLL